MQNLARSLMLRLLDDAAEGKPLEMDEQLVGAVRAALADPRADAAFKCAVLSMPGEGEISEMVSPADPAAIHTVREFVVSSLAGALEAELIADFEATMPTPGEAYSPDPASRARRSLHNTCQVRSPPHPLLPCVTSKFPQTSFLKPSVIIRPARSTESMLQKCTCVLHSYQNLMGLVPLSQPGCSEAT